MNDELNEHRFTSSQWLQVKTEAKNLFARYGYTAGKASHHVNNAWLFLTVAAKQYWYHQAVKELGYTPKPIAINPDDFMLGDVGIAKIRLEREHFFRRAMVAERNHRKVWIVVNPVIPTIGTTRVNFEPNEVISFTPEVSRKSHDFEVALKNKIRELDNQVNPPGYTTHVLPGKAWYQKALSDVRNFIEDYFNTPSDENAPGGENATNF